MYKLLKILFCSLLVCVLFIQGMQTEASEDAGGQVSTGGKISFYEEITDSSTSESVLPTTSSKSLPSTGEARNIYFIALGTILLFIFLFESVFRKRDEEVD